MTQRFVLAAAGDIVIRHRLFGEGAVNTDGFQELMAHMNKADLVWGSCEVQFSTRGFRTDSTIAYLVDPEVGRDLGQAGYQVMTVATNHTWDYGPDAFLDTLVHLREGGVEPIGGGRVPDEAHAPWKQEIQGVRVGILAVSCLVPPYYAVLPDRPGIAAVRIRQYAALDPIGMMIEPGGPIRVESFAEEEDVARLEAAIRALRGSVDVLIVSIHWGYGRGTPLATYQRPLAERVIGAGADFILGNHGHSPTAIETIGGKPVIYSLGNHIAQQDRINATPRQLEIFADIDPWSVIADIEIDIEGVRGIRLHPTCTGPDGLPFRLPSGEMASSILTRIRDLSAAVGTRIELGEGYAAWTRGEAV
jgi:poly-gamma-glutamate capsule biosynthesis protein CapA/YwtB (metallophosphatase superfamily)